MSRAQQGIALFKSGYGCAQAVLCTFSDVTGLDESTSLKIASSFGAGMGRLREVCGAVSAMFMVVGLTDGGFDACNTQAKAAHYKLVQFLAQKFKDKNRSIICRQLLGLEDIKTFDPTPQERTKEYYKARPCVELVGDACQILQEYFESKNN